MFVGYVKLGGTFQGSALFRNASETPTNIDAGTGAFQVYGPDGAMLNGSGSLTKLDVTAGLYQYAVEALGENGYEKGQSYRVVLAAEVSGLTVGQDQVFIVT